MGWKLKEAAGNKRVIEIEKEIAVKEQLNAQLSAQLEQS
jgi:hypothetical protein